MPGSAAITVGVVEGAGALRQRHLSAASARTTCCAKGPGSVVQGIIKETKAGFRLPDDPRDADHHDRPRHRPRAVPRLPAGARRGEAAGKKLGPAMLFFGCRHPDQDFIYGEELEALAKEATRRTARRLLAPRTARRPTCRTCIEAETQKIWKLIRGRRASSMSAATAAAWSRTSRRCSPACTASETGTSEDNSLDWIDKMTVEEPLRAGCLGGESAKALERIFAHSLRRRESSPREEALQKLLCRFDLESLAPCRAAANPRLRGNERIWASSCRRLAHPRPLVKIC